MEFYLIYPSGLRQHCDSVASAPLCHDLFLMLPAERCHTFHLER